MELVEYEKEQARLDKLDEKQVSTELSSRRSFWRSGFFLFHECRKHSSFESQELHGLVAIDSRAQNFPSFIFGQGSRQ